MEGIDPNSDISWIHCVDLTEWKTSRRVFMYHGAEHKTINCLEAGVEL